VKLFKKFLMSICLLFSFHAFAIDVPAKYVGDWEGSWYLGNSSGAAQLSIRPNGQGSLRLTNLDKFGDKEVPLENLKLIGNRINFSVTGKGGDEFSSFAFLIGDGRLKGEAVYGGDDIKYRLSRK
jgi:hypothetical protein